MKTLRTYFFFPFEDDNLILRTGEYIVNNYELHVPIVRKSATNPKDKTLKYNLGHGQFFPIFHIIFFFCLLAPCGEVFYKNMPCIMPLEKLKTNDWHTENLIM